MLITEIKQIDKFGEYLLTKNNPDEIIDNIVELPLRNACKIFARKGIETVMSSANRNNILKQGEKPVEKEDIGNRGNEFFLNRATFSDAGKGYAWIMLNFDTLSDENKAWLFNLEARTGNDGKNIGSKGVWFVRPFSIGGFYDILNYDCFGRRNIPKTLSPEEQEQNMYFQEFKKRYIVLGYNGDIYPVQSVFLRMPVTEETTVEQVDQYFSNLAESFKGQERKLPEQTKLRKSKSHEISHEQLEK